jgi:NitT/TauT family transport system permease protein
LPLFLLLWALVAYLLQSRFAPGPWSVALRVVELASHGHLIEDFLKTLARALAGFAIAMILGSVLGYLLGRHRSLDRLFASWVVVGLNIPAIVVAIICYIWIGLSETALVLAVVINKTPLVITTLREGVRALGAEYDEFAETFRLSRMRRLRIVVVPQLLPFVLAAARTGLSLVWKIVLVFEVLGSDGGVGFRVGVFFQFFDVTGILAYTVTFMAVVLLFEYGALRPLERRILAWRGNDA